MPRHLSAADREQVISRGLTTPEGRKVLLQTCIENLRREIPRTRGGDIQGVEEPLRFCREILLRLKPHYRHTYWSDTREFEEFSTLLAEFEAAIKEGTAKAARVNDPKAAYWDRLDRDVV